MTDLCEECEVPEHDTCSLTDDTDCPCCIDTWNNLP